ncbi:MAG: hypothetical protein JO111_11565 [Caulobacteraceae bacterium]|nr:hypothetical protein [Caulobacteraceae bacterium]
MSDKPGGSPAQGPERRAARLWQLLGAILVLGVIAANWPSLPSHIVSLTASPRSEPKLAQVEAEVSPQTSPPLKTLEKLLGGINITGDKTFRNVSAAGYEVPKPKTPVQTPAPAAPAVASGPAATDQAASKIKDLQTKYNAPPTIPLGSATTYRLIILSGRPLSPGDFKGAPGPVNTRQIPAVTLVRAQMSGPKAFVRIEPMSAPCQRVSGSDNPTWDWDVTPTSTKTFNLNVDLYEVRDCKDEASIDHRLDTFPITVTATLWQWLIYAWPIWKSALTGVLGLIGAAGAAFGAWKWLRGKKRGSHG